MKWLVQLLGFQQRRYISTKMSIKNKRSSIQATSLISYLITSKVRFLLSSKV